MIARALASAVLVALLTAGCTQQAVRSPSPAPPTIAPLPTPSAQPEEVTRATFGGGTVRAPAGPVPASGQLEVQVACAGTDGSRMHWALVTGDGTPLGLSGDADCSGPPTAQWLGITATPRPASARVRLLPASGVVAGYAIVRSGTP